MYMGQRCLHTPEPGKGLTRSAGWLCRISDGIVLRLVSVRFDIAGRKMGFVINVVIL
jgi:hypothetical protein